MLIRIRFDLIIFTYRAQNQCSVPYNESLFYKKHSSNLSTLKHERNNPSNLKKAEDLSIQLLLGSKFKKAHLSTTASDSPKHHHILAYLFFFQNGILKAARESYSLSEFRGRSGAPAPIIFSIRMLIYGLFRSHALRAELRPLFSNNMNLMFSQFPFCFCWAICRDRFFYGIQAIIYVTF